MVTRFSKIFLVFSLVFVGLFLIYPTVNAAGLVPCGRNAGTPEEMRPCTTCDLFALASNIMNFVLFTVVPAVAVLFYLIGGLMILLSRGSPGLVATGKTFFWNTTWGLVIIFGAWMITNTVLKSLVGDKDISNNWYKIECTSVVQQQPSVQRYTCGSTGCVAKSDGEYTELTCDGKCRAVAPTSLACMFNGVNYSTFNLCSGQKRSSCGTSVCSQYLSSINRYAGGAATASVLKTFLVIESDCNIKAGTSSSFGLMQLRPSTANQFKSRCGVTESITASWLTDPTNADKSICIGAAFIKSIAAGTCGSEPRNIYAGYNAGPGNCAASSDCASDKNCSGETVKRWECPYDNTAHTVCNTGMYETKQGATYVNYCLNNLGF